MRADAVDRTTARFVAGRLASLLATLLAASIVVYVGLYLAPGSPLSYLSGGRTLPPETLHALTEQYHLDQPFLGRFAGWLGDVVRGDFGESIVHQQSVTSLLGSRVGTTALLIVLATAMMLVAGVGLGMLAAVRGGRVDTGISVLTSLGLAIPPFVAAIILISVFAVGLGWFPTFGPGEGFGDRLWHLVLPAVALALTTTAFVARVTRTSAKEELLSDHVEAARVRGLPERSVIRRHVFRNALIPISTAAGLTAASLIAGSVIVDQAFALNGLGSYLVDAVNQRDYPVVQAIVLILVAAFVVLNTVIDLLYPVIDPRLRAGGHA